MFLNTFSLEDNGSKTESTATFLGERVKNATKKNIITRKNATKIIMTRKNATKKIL